MAISVITTDEVDAVSGAFGDDVTWATSIGVSGTLLALGMSVTAPVWAPAALIGGSIVASGFAIYYAW